MCLDVKSDAKIETIEKDKLVFKYSSRDNVDNNTFRSANQGYNYQRGKLQPYVRITILYDSTVGEGYHSVPECYNSKYCRDGMFVIPKGSQLIKGEYDDMPCYVSSQIIYLGIYSFWKKVKYFLFGKKAFI